MANLKASIKDIRQTSKRTDANRRVRTSIKTLSKKVENIAQESKEDSAALASKFAATLDKAAKRGIIHKNKANRLKSKTAQRVSASQ